MDAAAAAGLEHSDVAMVDASGNNPVDGEEEGENEGVDHQYVSTETNANVAHVNTHAQLEALRDQAVLDSAAFGSEGAGGVKRDVQGPRVLLTGPTDSGKSALQRVLTSYAVKLGRSPMLVDLDTAHNCLSVPGTFAASAISSYDSVSVESYVNQGAIMPSSSPIVFWNGSTNVTKNMALSKLQITKLGECLNARMKNDTDSKNSGCIVNTSGLWIEGDGYELLKHAIDALQINVIFVVGQDRLYSILSSYCNSLGNSEDNGTSSINCKVIKLPVSGGVVSRDNTLRRSMNQVALKSVSYCYYVLFIR